MLRLQGLEDISKGEGILEREKSWKKLKAWERRFEERQGLDVTSDGVCALRVWMLLGK